MDEPKLPAGWEDCVSDEELKATVAGFVYYLMQMADKAEERYREEQQGGDAISIARWRSYHLVTSEIVATAKRRFKDALKTSNE